MWTANLIRPGVREYSDGRISLEVTRDEFYQIGSLVELYLGHTAFTGDKPRPFMPFLNLDLLQESDGDYILKICRKKQFAVSCRLRAHDLESIYEAWMSPMEDDY